jgi:cyclase
MEFSFTLKKAKQMDYYCFVIFWRYKMHKKRLIFTLLYKNGNFMLSRNFRLQQVGNLDWLFKNYVFSKISLSIDELIVLDVSRCDRNVEAFCRCLSAIARDCFVPISAGGGIRSIDHAQMLFHSGADKLIVNSLLSQNIDLLFELASLFGRQSIIASVDVKRSDDAIGVWTENGTRKENIDLFSWLTRLLQLPIGEIYLNSIDRDGTGQGYDLGLLKHLPESIQIPFILAGGAGTYEHLAEGLREANIDAVATAHLFNFIGDGLEKARQNLLSGGIDLPSWNSSIASGLNGYFL